MARKPKTHIPAAHQLAEILVAAQPYGGFAVSKPSRNDHGRIIAAPIASFTTTDELLDWLRDNLARPAQEPQAVKS